MLVYVQKIEGVYSFSYGLELLESSGTLPNTVSECVFIQSEMGHVTLCFLDVSEILLFDTY